MRRLVVRGHSVLLSTQSCAGHDRYERGSLLCCCALWFFSHTHTNARLQVWGLIDVNEVKFMYRGHRRDLLVACVLVRTSPLHFHFSLISPNHSHFVVFVVSSLGSLLV